MPLPTIAQALPDVVSLLMLINSAVAPVALYVQTVLPGVRDRLTMTAALFTIMLVCVVAPVASFNSIGDYCEDRTLRDVRRHVLPSFVPMLYE